MGLSLMVLVSADRAPAEKPFYRSCAVDAVVTENLSDQAGPVTLQQVSWNVWQDQIDAANETNTANDNLPPPAPLEGFLVRIPLPIVGEVDVRVQKLIEKAMERLPVAADRRPVLVLEFDTSKGATGEGSQLERCVALARYLTSLDIKRVQTVAYIPASDTRFEEIELFDGPKLTELRGHAVLVALSCERLVMDEETAITAAGIDEPVIENFMRYAYRDNLGHRRMFPEELAMSLLDKQMVLYRVSTEKGTDFLQPAELEKLEAAGKAISAEKITDVGTFPVLTSEILQEYRLIQYRVSSRKELAERLGIRADVLQGDPSLSGQWRPLHIRFQGPIHKREVDWILKALSQQVLLSNPSLIIVEIDSPGGDPQQCLRMAQRLAEFNPLDVRTVAFVSNEARGASSLIAMGCDNLIMTAEAVLGGGARLREDGGPRRRDEFEPVDLEEFRPAIRELAAAKEMNWSLTLALFDPTVSVNRMKNNTTGLFRLLSREELKSLDDADDWADTGAFDLKDGLEGSRADALGITRQLASTFEEVKTFYQLSEDPVLLQPTLTDKWIQRLGQHLASPMIAGWLLFGTMFFLMVELSHPGIGVPGFLSAICCMLFFWSQYCDGNASWLEILMFAVGMIFLLIEIFFIPGVGVFGIGGGLMVVASIVLATQDFIWPRTSAELSRLPVSLSMILFASGGFFVSILFIRTFLPHIPYFNKLILKPPGSEEGLQSLAVRESLTHYEYLLGKRGVTTTSLLPSGKARFGDEICNVITDGRVIEKDQYVIVKKVDGNRIEVRPANDV